MKEKFNPFSELSAMAEMVHALAKQKGWHNLDEDDRAFMPRCCANLHGEVSELWEAYRKGKLREPCDKAIEMENVDLYPLNCMEEEMADILIRLLDAAKRQGADIARAVYVKHQFNRTRSYRHGGKLA